MTAIYSACEIELETATTCEFGNCRAIHSEIEAILRKVYRDDTNLWMRRWRWFFLATSGLFGYADGSEWGVSHYRMRKVS